MYELDELIKIFYPTASLERAARLSLRCQKDSMEYYPDTWEKVQRLDLMKEKVQLNLVRTYYQYQFGYYEGTETSIMQSLEDWSEKGVVRFKFLSNEDNDFYERFYIFLGFQNFSQLKISRQLYLLGARFIVFAAAWKIDLYESLAKFFASYCWISDLQEDASMFMGALERNQTVVMQDQGKELTVAGLVEKFRAFRKINTSSDINIFFENEEDFKKLTPTAQQALKPIVHVYDEMWSDRIWKNIDESLCIDAHSERQEYDPDELYIQFLREAQDIGPWIESFADVAKWLKDKSVDFLQQLIVVLKQKIDLKNEQHVEFLFKFVEELGSYEIKEFDNLLVFNEVDNQFHWR